MISTCSIEDANRIESEYIIKLNTLFPNGYNLKIHQNKIQLSEETKKNVSIGVQKYYTEQRYLRFKDVIIDINKIDKYIRLLKRDKKPFGYYVYINKLKTDFGGVHISLEKSYSLAYEFIQNLYKRQRDNLLRETP